MHVFVFGAETHRFGRQFLSGLSCTRGLQAVLAVDFVSGALFGVGVAHLLLRTWELCLTSSKCVRVIKCEAGSVRGGSGCDLFFPVAVVNWYALDFVEVENYSFLTSWWRSSTLEINFCVSHCFRHPKGVSFSLDGGSFGFFLSFVFAVFCAVLNLARLEFYVIYSDSWFLFIFGGFLLFFPYPKLFKLKLTRFAVLKECSSLVVRPSRRLLTGVLFSISMNRSLLCFWRCIFSLLHELIYGSWRISCIPQP